MRSSVHSIILILAVLALPAAVHAASGGHTKLKDANVDLSSKTSLQRGAKVFVNYCVSCHSASFMRYNRIAKDLGLSEEAVEDNLMFTTNKIGDTMNVAMDPADSEAWFGVTPPDLSVIARSRGADWLFNFLQSYYVDDSKPTGVNNLIFTDTAMPHVLADLQGLQRATFNVEMDENGNEHRVFAGFELISAGQQSPEQYEQTVRDLTAFLVYLGEPAKLVRYKIGFWVLVFLSILWFATYLMKREYWKDVH
ncbi:MAG: cytochrome c1 [Gammaproteobacteria bacterium]